MVFNRFTQGLLIFIGGWVMGWFSYHHWFNEGVTGYYRQLPELTVTLIEEPPATDDTPPAAPQPNAVVRLLRAQRFNELMDQYDNLVARNDQNGVRWYQNEIFNYINDLLVVQEYAQAVTLLTRYLQSEFNDVEGRLTLAEIYQQQGETMRAINTLYQAKTYAYRADTVTQINHEIRQAVAAHDAALAENRDYLGMFDVYQHLTQWEPDHSPFFVGLARAQLALSDYAGARQSLSLVMHDPSVDDEVQALLAMMDQNSVGDAVVSSEVAIPLQRIGNHFLVEGWIDNTYPIVLLIDTGASLTVLQPTTLQSAGLSQGAAQKFGSFKTANGEVEAPVLTLGGLTVGDFTVDALEVGVLELSALDGVDGLLGMNYLRHFQFFIDQTNSVLRLSPNNT